MPNGGIHHCGRCKHQHEKTCSLRNITISKTSWTTCSNWDQDVDMPSGPIFAIVCEVKNGAGAYAEIPYYKGNRVDTYQINQGDTLIRFTDEKGNVMEVPDVETYIKYYEENKE